MQIPQSAIAATLNIYNNANVVNENENENETETESTFVLFLSLFSFLRRLQMFSIHFAFYLTVLQTFKIELNPFLT